MTTTIEQHLTEDTYALYCGDSCEVLKAWPDDSLHLSIFSPPFAKPNGGSLYTYSSDVPDLSNSRTYDEFFEHLGFILRELTRVTLPGRMSCVHCMDVPSGNTGDDDLTDFPGDIIRAYQAMGWRYKARFAIWKDALVVRNRTMAKVLAHKTIVDDSAFSGNAGADYVLVFQHSGTNPIPIQHPTGLLSYAGDRNIPHELWRYRGWQGKQTENRYSHWIWQRYAAAIWDDIRVDRVLPYREARDPEDEKHVHPLQLDVIERLITLYSNPGETVLDPFAGVGSVPYEAVRGGRRGVGIELKRSYYRQMLKNVPIALKEWHQDLDQPPLAFDNPAPVTAVTA